MRLSKQRGIPTVHNGRRYRSRLEARWGSFFDLLGWPYEYEPFDLKGWIPDFILLGTTPVLVEVKPVPVFPFHLVDEVKLSGTDPEHEILFVGCTIPVKPLHARPDGVCFGWLADRDVKDHGFDFSDALFGQWDGKVGFYHGRNACADRISGNCDFPGTISPHHVYGLWASAGNTTQWMGVKS